MLANIIGLASSRNENRTKNLIETRPNPAQLIPKA